MGRRVPANHLYLGEIDLTRCVRGLPVEVLESFTYAAGAGLLPICFKIFASPSAAEQLDGIDREIIRCATLDQAILATWPDLH
jgi:hypothetical protein